MWLYCSLKGSKKTFLLFKDQSRKKTENGFLLLSRAPQIGYANYLRERERERERERIIYCVFIGVLLVFLNTFSWNPSTKGRSKGHATWKSSPPHTQSCECDMNQSVASTEKDIDTRLTKAWTAINRLSIIWKSDLTDKIKRSFFQAAVTSILLYGCTTWTLTKRFREEARRQLHKNAASNLEQVLTATPHKTPTVRPPASYHENYSS